MIEVPSETLGLFILRDFLGAPECRATIELIDANRKPSRLFSTNPDPSFRTSETCNLDPNNSLVRDIDIKLSTLTGIDRAFGEFLQGQRYGVGQQYKPHHDYLRTNEPYWRRQEKIGGQRTWTAMVYLNVPDGGGETRFPRLNLIIRPRSGSLVIWNNLDERGEPHPLTLHESLPITAGSKYVITKWYRERPWAGQRGR